MKSPLLSVSSFLAALSFLAPGARAADGVEISPAGLKIVTVAYGKEFMKTAPFQSFNTGTELALGVTVKGTRIIALDEDKSELTSFTDDKGTDLAGDKGDFGSFPKVSEDGLFGILEVSGAGIPAAGATKIMAKGTLAVTLGGKTATTRSKAVAIKKGTTFTLGDYKFSLTETGESGDDEKPTSITIQAKQNLDGVAEFRFFTEDGKAIEASANGSSSSGFNNSVTIEKFFHLGTKAKTILVEIDAFTDLKAEMIPFDITTGLGVGQK